MNLSTIVQQVSALTRAHYATGAVSVLPAFTAEGGKRITAEEWTFTFILKRYQSKGIKTAETDAFKTAMQVRNILEEKGN
jgi:hypothetical protein